MPHKCFVTCIRDFFLSARWQMSSLVGSDSVCLIGNGVYVNTSGQCVSDD